MNDEPIWYRQLNSGARKYHAFRPGDSHSLCGRHRWDHPFGWHLCGPGTPQDPGYWYCLACHNKAS